MHGKSAPFKPGDVITSETVLTAHVLQVGGGKGRRRAIVQLLGSETLTRVHIPTKRLAVRVARKLYELVGLRGTATWVVSPSMTRLLHRFEVKGVVKPRVPVEVRLPAEGEDGAGA